MGEIGSWGDDSRWTAGTASKPKVEAQLVSNWLSMSGDRRDDAPSLPAKPEALPSLESQSAARNPAADFLKFFENRIFFKRTDRPESGDREPQIDVDSVLNRLIPMFNGISGSKGNIDLMIQRNAIASLKSNEFRSVKDITPQYVDRFFTFFFAKPDLENAKNLLRGLSELRSDFVKDFMEQDFSNTLSEKDISALAERFVKVYEQKIAQR